MKKLLWLCVLLSVSAFAEEQAKPEPLDDAFMGFHPMVLVSNGTTLYAYHMPKYAKPNDVQLLYAVSAPAGVTYLVRDADLVTIKPEPFNLQRLLRGQAISLKADVYMGHFERGGMLTHPAQQIEFDEKLYMRKLEDLKPPSTKRVYDQVELNRSAHILMHRIEAKPSFDHVVLVIDKQNCSLEFNTRSLVPKAGELLGRMLFCGSLKPLYYEANDFK